MLDQVLIIVGVTVLVMITPGPDMAIVTRNTLLGGRTGGIRTSAGVLTGNLVHITYCVLGIGLLISQSIVAFSVLRYAGAAYLVYLGLSSLVATDQPATASARPDVREERTWFLQGFVNNVLNPKGTLFYLGVFTMVITPDTTAGTTMFLILVMMLISALFWLLFVATLDHPAIRGTLYRSQKTVGRVFGVLLVGLGLRVALLER
jgi:RhtB (resistance to homoserine/threonine) family protein